MGATRINRAAEQGVRTRATIEAGVLAAGAAGIKTRDLAPILGVTAHCIDFQLRAMRSVVIKATPEKTYLGRLFHAQFAAEAAAYVDKINAEVRGRSRRGKPSAATCANAEMILRRAGAVGMSAKEVAAATGLHKYTCSVLLAMLIQSGKAACEPDKRVGKSRPYRYWAAGFPTIKQPVNVKAQVKYQCDKVRKSAGKPAPKARPVYEPIITAQTKVTICPSNKDFRHTVHVPQKCFSGLPPGTYLPDDTWAARAYA